MGHRWLEEKEHATFVCQFSNLLILNGIIVQLAFWCRYAVNNMHAHVLPTFLNGPTCLPGNWCCFAAPNNRCFSGKRQRHPPPPPQQHIPNIAVKIFPPNVQGNKGLSVVCITSKNNPPYADCPPSRPPPSSPCSISPARAVVIRLRREGYPPKRNSRLTSVLMADRVLLFSPFSKCGTYAPQNDRSENTTMRLFDFWSTGSRFGESGFSTSLRRIGAEFGTGCHVQI